LVARVRVNSCFARVASSGLRKMASHVIAFKSPVPKIYHKLPPPIEELDEVLAILFTGPCEPTEKEFQRTPLLVRRNQVAQALEWLKLNHSDYADLEIAYDELDHYPEDSPPVSVQYQHALTNKVVEGTSVFDDALDDGVDQGDCLFVVHGLMGEQLDTRSVTALKGIALRHWNNHGAALAISHDDSPQSIYNNPNLYPQIFPWLFPYGLGGIGATKLSEKLHKRRLLMYHDKCFQRDVCFPFVAFSHQQVKASTTGGFLLAETQKFDEIDNRLLNVNQEVLENMAKRMSDGETVKPSTEDESACFQLIRDLDHIDGKVSGSITSKRYMRNEIWSLIAYLGAPVWYITLTPADNKHPISLYFADNKEKLDVTLTRSEDERY
jgi:Helitron helicase-like domain at N-terminus